MLRADIHPDGVAVMRLDQPERRNALSIALRDAISETLEAWAGDDRVRAVTLTAAGSTFCAGFDLKEFAEPDLANTIRDSSHRYHLAVWRFPKPVIAAIDGPALGGGFDLALLCDVRIATTNAVFGHPEIKFGAPPLFTPLQWIVGAGIARELCLTGRRVDAAEAHRIGLVNTVVDAERVEEEAMATARVMLEAPQPALEATKRYLVSSAGVTFDEAFTVEHDRVFDQFLLGEL
ncbi:enoyl-CoA hydratase/isomerase family protein [Mycolicibacterium sp. 120270]|uniref:enoyl-CoA hydratase/isomerase family protein n=1 Tax=Mycolicibacterium sp. 120270 TaxID=3090600 RepID=UPI00299F3AC9|nr:enoyl-CoA hydratase/isomerase family protein [Mycolicibacterium sp. 120270]MDX1884530.1 enoyl-CoA hydratase/isomerase family protein [Mycolicibacterium sp. 120270]